MAIRIILLTSEQLRAARAIVRWDQKLLAEHSGVSIPTIKRLEAQIGPLAANTRTVAALQTALEAAGVVLLDAGMNIDGGPGVRMRV